MMQLSRYYGFLIVILGSCFMLVRADDDSAELYETAFENATLPYSECDATKGVYCIGGPHSHCVRNKTCLFMSTYQSVKMNHMVMVHVKVAAYRDRGFTDFYAATGLARHKGTMGKAAVFTCVLFNGTVKGFSAYNTEAHPKYHYIPDEELKLTQATFVDNILTCRAMRGSRYAYGKEEEFPLLNTKYYPIMAYGKPRDNKGNLYHHHHHMYIYANSSIILNGAAASFHPIQLSTLMSLVVLFYSHETF